MKVITISGIIARWEMSSESNVTPETLRESLNDANGESVRIDINSPGGNVAEGLEMYNMIKNYAGHTETRIVSMAASMGSIIALAGDKKTAEKTASYMIHNVSGFSWGDYRALRKYADRLENMTAHLSTVYTDRAGIANDTALQMMNDETWRYGDQLMEFGFEIVDASDDTNLESAKFNSHNRYDNYVAEMKARPEEFEKDLEKAVASIGGLIKTKGDRVNFNKEQNSTSTKPVPNSGNDIEEENNSMAKMTKEEFKAQNPEAYEEIMQAGRDKERDVVTAHITMGEAGNCMGLAVKNIKEGNTITATVQAEYMAEGMKSIDITNRNDDDDDTPLAGNGEDLETGNEDKDTKEFTAKFKNHRNGGVK
jgi:ATP-dependent protease ClpP protease subunit